MLIFLLLLIILVMVMGYVIFNLVKKNETLENWIVNLSLQIQIILEKINEIDSTEAFQSDDEVGETWVLLKDVLETLKDFGMEEEKIEE